MKNLAKAQMKFSDLPQQQELSLKLLLAFYEPNKSILYTINFENPDNPLLTQDLCVKGIDGIINLSSLEKTEIKVKVTPDAAGYFRKTVTVFCNIDKGTIPLTVKGTVKE